jgi:hypothetical protein
LLLFKKEDSTSLQTNTVRTHITKHCERILLGYLFTYSSTEPFKKVTGLIVKIAFCSTVFIVVRIYSSRDSTNLLTVSHHLRIRYRIQNDWVVESAI